MSWHDNSSSLSGKYVALMYVISLALAIARLAGVIDWSWWIVLLPIWTSAAIVVMFVVGAGSVLLVAELLYLRDRTRWQRRLLQEDTQTA